MNKGYILAFTLRLLILVSTIFLIMFQHVKTTSNINQKANYLYKRLLAEKYIFDEILARLYVFDFESFDDFYGDFDFSVTMSEKEIIIKVSQNEIYEIKVTYEEECHCFSEILYK